jgi:hypothetical protein
MTGCPGRRRSSERVRDAWESWSVDRKRAAIRAVLYRVVINPVAPDAPNSPGGRLKDPTRAANARWRSYASVSNSTGAYDANQCAPSICGESLLAYRPLKGS